MITRLVWLYTVGLQKQHFYVTLENVNCAMCIVKIKYKLAGIHSIFEVKYISVAVFAPDIALVC